MKRPMLVGNWKMNGLGRDLEQIEAMARAIKQNPPRASVVICPPPTLLHRMSEALNHSAAVVGGQDCHPLPGGSFTGEVSAEMLAEAGARVVILGHSERRQARGETNEEVAAKVLAAARADLFPIICVGEAKQDRDAGLAVGMVKMQVAASLPDILAETDFAIAYEPVWAIGTGSVPSGDEIVEIHRAIRSILVARFGARGAATAILYGGSVAPANAREILRLPEVDGVLVGGASLKAEAFVQILQACVGV